MEAPTAENIHEIQVEAQADHLDSIAKARPLNALTELIWNALDADADRVEVDIVENKLSGIEKIIITDNGDGLAFEEAEAAFSKLGGSWKKGLSKTRRKGRSLHGREGKGRFKSFAIGSNVTWETIFQKGNDRFEYSINGNRGNLKAFKPGPVTLSNETKTGTKVIIENLIEKLGPLVKIDPVLDYLSEQFAIYLKDNPDVKIIYCGNKVDPSRVQKAYRQIPFLDIPLGDGKVASALLEIFEWTTNKKERRIRLCDERGIPLGEIEAGVRPGSEFNFTAYLRSSYISELHKENMLELGESCQGLKAMLEAARSGMRNYFRQIKAASALDVVKKWKDDGIYPYENEPIDDLEKARRDVFDICAINVHEYLDIFRQSPRRDQKFTLVMLKTALEENPSALKRILTEVLGLSKERQRDLADLLDKTSFPAIIEAATVVTERLAFLEGLKEMLFDPTSKATLQEKSQLHKILENEAWIFGEEFYLSESEISLTNVLRKHIDLLRPEKKKKSSRNQKQTESLKLDDGRDGRIDLMLARSIPSYGKNKKEYLVVELKRPSQKITLEIKNQLEAYALALSRDEQIDYTNTTWTFLAVSNEISEDAYEVLTQTDKPAGFFINKENLKVGLTTWSQIIQASQTRLELFKESIGKGVGVKEGLKLLNTKYNKYIPDCLKADPRGTGDPASANSPEEASGIA